MTQSNLRREGFIPLHGLVSIMKGGQGKNLRQEPGHRNWSRGHRGSLLAGLLFKACSSCLLIWPRTTRPGQHYSHGPGPATSFIKRGARFSLTPHSVQWVELDSDSHFCYKCDNNKKKKIRNFPTELSIGSLMETFPTWRSLSSQITQACVKLKKKLTRIEPISKLSHLLK